MAIFNSNELYVIVTSWFDNPFDEFVYTDLEQTEILCAEYNLGKSDHDASYGNVMSLNDYYYHQYERGSSAASYE